VSAGFSFLEGRCGRSGNRLRRFPSSGAISRFCIALESIPHEAKRDAKSDAATHLRDYRPSPMKDDVFQGFKNWPCPMPQCSAAERKIVSNQTGSKKFLLNLFWSDRAARAALLSRGECDNVLRSDLPHSRPKFVSRNVQKINNTRSRLAA
jgi:hypothetical protein